MSYVENNNIIYKPILKGRIDFEPVYKEQELEEYTNNPFIEALPGIFDDEEIIVKFTHNPIFHESDKDKRTNVRFHMIKRLKSFVQPLDIHFSIERKLACMIRRGYIARNPFSHEYLNRLKLINDTKNESDYNKLSKLEELNDILRSTADSFSIIGISGMGKSTAVERLLLMYPQTIHHHEYDNKPFTRTQLVWLKIDCPYDGSLKTLCKTFFKAVDDVLETTNYFKKYGDNRNSTATMMIHMTYVASIYSIGVLVIDEIQHLINPKNPPEEMLNFFVTLVNIIGLPTVLVGTPSSKKVLTKKFRQGRRAEADGSIAWDRMKKDAEWDFFLETIWDYQWLREFTPLSSKLNDVMYGQSQGITSLVVIIFMLAQERALASGIEKITEGLIREVVDKDLNLVKDMIKALRNNDIEKLNTIDDLTIDTDPILENISRDINVRQRVAEMTQSQRNNRVNKANSIKEHLTNELLALDLFKSLEFNDVSEVVESTIKNLGISEDIRNIKQEVIKECFIKDERITEKKKNSRKSNNTEYEEDDLRKLFKKAEIEKKHVYELLKCKGYIMNPFHEFYD